MNALVTVNQALMAPEMQRQLTTFLPKDVPIDRFTEVVMMALRDKPELLDANRETFYDSCLTLAKRGLLPDKKEAALVVYNVNIAAKGQPPRYEKRVQAQPMVEGIIKEMGKAGVLAYAVSVYANDAVEIWNDDDGQHVKHIPIMFKPRGERVGAFAAGKLPNGRTYVELMNMEELEKIALRSKQAYNGQRGGTWKSDPERMEQKSCLHRLRRRIPIFTDLTPDDDFDPEATIEPLPQSMPEVQPFQQARNEQTNEAVDRTSRRPRALRAVIEQTQEPEYNGNDII